MELAVGRLMDKSINAVKSAIQLLAAFIAHNPYSCKVNEIILIFTHNSRNASSDFTISPVFCVFQLSSADLKKPLEKETAKLREMKEKLQGKAPGQDEPCLLSKNEASFCVTHAL